MGARPGWGDARAGPGPRAASASEDPERELADAQVDHGDEGHDHRDEHEHDARVGDQLRPRGPDDLLQLRDDLADEERDAREQAARRLALAGGLGRRVGRAAEPSASDAAAGAVSLTSGPYVSWWSGSVRNPTDGRADASRRTDRRSCSPLLDHRANPEDQTRAQGRQDSNLQPAVLETAALPIAPLPYGGLASMTTRATPRTPPGGGPRGYRSTPGHGSSWRTSTAGGPLYATSAAWVEPSPAASGDGPGAPCSPADIGWHRADVTSATMGPVSEQTPPRPRVSARLAAIAESATLAVDAKAKALKAAGRPGDRLRRRASPTSRRPATSSTPRSPRRRTPSNHRYTPAAGPARRCARRSPRRRCATPATR